MSEMSRQGKAKSTQPKVGVATTTIINDDGEVVAWDAVEEAVHCTPMCDKNKKMTAPEAAAHFKINLEGLYARARRHGWKLVPGRLRNRQKKAGMKFDWGAKGDEHREAAFEVATKSVKLFKPRAPKSFKDLEIADRIARRSAGLETAEVVNQTLVHINEAIEDHGDAQVIEATEVGNTEQGDQAAPIEDAIVVDNEDTVAALPAPTD